MSNAKHQNILGYAVYLEYRQGERTNQFLFTPPMPNRETGTLVQAFALTRIIDQEHPRKTWRFRSIETPDITYNGAKREISQISDWDKAVTAVTPMLDAMKHYIARAKETEWNLTQQPIVVEVTLEDARYLDRHRSPEALIRRIRAARKDYGFPENEWNIDKPEEEL